MAGKKGQKKRVWSDDEKRLICAQARVTGVSVAQVARRYAMNTNLIHTWLRDPRFTSEGQTAELPEPEEAVFLPIEVSGVTSAPAPHIPRSSPTGPATAQRVDITLSNGRRILVEGPTALSAIVAMVEGLTQ